MNANEKFLAADAHVDAAAVELKIKVTYSKATADEIFVSALA